jgi:hypothetical protein
MAGQVLEAWGISIGFSIVELTTQSESRNGIAAVGPDYRAHKGANQSAHGVLHGPEKAMFRFG